MIHLSEKKKLWVSILVLLLVCGATFACSVSVRRPWFGKMSSDHTWMTGSAIKFTKNWVDDGPASIHFGMYENPRSIEFPTLASRIPYVSYPPGTILPIYLLSVVSGQKPGPGMVMAYDLLNQFLIAFFLGLTILIFLRRLKVRFLFALPLSVIPTFMMILMPISMYYMQNSYFSDEAVLLPVVLFIFLEVVGKGLERRSAKVAVEILQALVMFYGVFTDWFFVFVAIVCYAIRILTGDLGRRLLEFLRKSVVFWIPAAVAIVLFAVQMTVMHAFSFLREKFLLRTGISGTGTPKGGFLNVMWNYLSRGYGSVGAVLVVLSLLFVVLVLAYLVVMRLRKKQVDQSVKQIAALSSLLALPCVLQVIAFTNHSMVHFFSVLKFSIVIATVPFVLAPIGVYLLARGLVVAKEGLDEGNAAAGNRSRNVVGATVAILIALSIAFTAVVFPGYKKLFADPLRYDIEKFVGEATQYRDVVVSPYYEIPYNPPQQVAFSMKISHLFGSLKDVYEVVKNIDGNYSIDVLLLDSRYTSDPNELQKISWHLYTPTVFNSQQQAQRLGQINEVNASDVVGQLIGLANGVVERKGVIIYRISKPDLLALFRRNGLPGEK